MPNCRKAVVHGRDSDRGCTISVLELGPEGCRGWNCQTCDSRSSTFRVTCLDADERPLREFWFDRKVTRDQAVRFAHAKIDSTAKFLCASARESCEPGKGVVTTYTGRFGAVETFRGPINAEAHRIQWVPNAIIERANSSSNESSAPRACPVQ